MRNTVKKVILIILLLAILMLGISIVLSLKSVDEGNYYSETVNETNGDTLQVENEQITNLTDRRSKDFTASTEIKNISNLKVSQINLYYKELDKKDNEVSESEIIIDMTLNPEDSMEVQFMPKDYTNTIIITGYTYITEDCEVTVNLKDKNIKIKENNRYLENSKNYEVLAVKKLYTDKSEKNYAIGIKNISNKNLGNIVLKIGEVDENNKFVKFDHITFNSILKPGQSEEIVSFLSDYKYDVRILGYTYDDIESKRNIDIDLTTNKVNIIDNN